MTDTDLLLTLQLNASSEETAEDIAELGQRLRTELLELDIQTVKPLEVESPNGSKVGLAVDWTTLLVTLAASGGVITTMIVAIKDWLVRNQVDSVTIRLGEDELTLTGAGPYSDEQQRMVNLWLSRHKGYMLSNE